MPQLWTSPQERQASIAVQPIAAGHRLGAATLRTLTDWINLFAPVHSVAPFPSKRAAPNKYCSPPVDPAVQALRIHKKELVMDECRSKREVNVRHTIATDEALVAAVRAGDHGAFAVLWERHSRIALHMAFRITGNRDDAEDVMQDAWMKAYVHLKSFDGRSKFSTWVTRIAINSALMALRRRRSHPETSVDTAEGEGGQHWEIPDRGKDVEDLYAKDERAERLRRAICRLKPALRKVVEIHQKKDGSVKEIADIAGISVAATKSRLLRARVILRRALR